MHLIVRASAVPSRPPSADAQRQQPGTAGHHGVDQPTVCGPASVPGPGSTAFVAPVGLDVRSGDAHPRRRPQQASSRHAAVCSKPPCCCPGDRKRPCARGGYRSKPPCCRPDCDTLRSGEEPCRASRTPLPPDGVKARIRRLTPSGGSGVRDPERGDELPVAQPDIYVAEQQNHRQHPHLGRPESPETHRGGDPRKSRRPPTP